MLKQLWMALALMAALMLGSNLFGLADPAVIQAGQTVYAPPQGAIDRLTLELQNARVLDMNATALTLEFRKVDIPTGHLDSLTLNGQQVEAAGLRLKELSLNASNVNVDAFQLFNLRRLVLTQPLTAQTRFSLTQEALAQFLNTPDMKASIEKSLNKASGGLLRFEVSNTNVKFRQPQTVWLETTLRLNDSVSLPLATEGQLVLSNGAPALTNLQVMSNTMMLPKELGPLLAAQFNQAIHPTRLLEGHGTATLSSLSMPVAGLLQMTGTATIQQMDLQSKL